MIIRRVFAFIFICSLTIATKASADFCVKIHNPLSGATSFTNKPHEDEQTFFVQNPTNESQTLRYYLNSDKEQKLTTVILPLSVVAIKANSLEILAPLRKHSDGLCKNFNSTYYDYDQFKDKSLVKTNVIALLTSRIEFFISYSPGVAETKITFFRCVSISSNFNGLLSYADGNLNPCSTKLLFRARSPLYIPPICGTEI